MSVLFKEKKTDMSKRNNEDNEADDLPKFRQIQLVGMNESIMLISNYPGEDMNFLSGKALRMYKKIRTPKE